MTGHATQAPVRLSAPWLFGAAAAFNFVVGFLFDRAQLIPLMRLDAVVGTNTVVFNLMWGFCSPVRGMRSCASASIIHQRYRPYVLRRTMTTEPFCVKMLNSSTWRYFADLMERHNGVWNGCWCLAFHEEGGRRDMTAEERRAAKERLVSEGRARAALVYDGSSCIGWCQFGRTEELPRIKSRHTYLAGLSDLPDWRITCFFIDKAYRDRGVAEIALRGALEEIARQGGGKVESYPEDVGDQKVSASFLHNATLPMFERTGFGRDRLIGNGRWVVSKNVAAQDSCRPVQS